MSVGLREVKMDILCIYTSLMMQMTASNYVLPMYSDAHKKTMKYKSVTTENRFNR